MHPGVLLAVQSAVWVVAPPSPTVGDTVVLETVVIHEDPAVRVRTGAVEATRAFEPLRAPGIFYEPEGVRIRHVLAVFEAGEPSVDLPEIELTFPDGRSETIDGGRVTLAVPSVLPEGDTLPAPRWSRAPIPRATTRPEPALLLAAVTLSVTGGWWLARRRVGPRPAWAVSPPPAVEPPLTKWIAAGEPRAVAAVVMAHVRQAIASRLPAARTSLSVQECLEVIRHERPSWPYREIADLLVALGRASFAPAVPSDVLVLVDESEDVLKALEGDGDDAAEGSA